MANRRLPLGAIPGGGTPFWNPHNIQNVLDHGGGEPTSLPVPTGSGFPSGGFGPPAGGSGGGSIQVPGAFDPTHSATQFVDQTPAIIRLQQLANFCAAKLCIDVRSRVDGVIDASTALVISRIAGKIVSIPTIQNNVTSFTHQLQILAESTTLPCGTTANTGGGNPDSGSPDGGGGPAPQPDPGSGGSPTAPPTSNDGTVIVGPSPSPNAGPITVTPDGSFVPAPLAPQAPSILDRARARLALMPLGTKLAIGAAAVSAVALTVALVRRR